MMTVRLRYIALILCCCLLSACAGRSRLQTRIVSDAETNVCTLAVLPFENWTPKGELALLGSRLFASELVQSGGFNLIQQGDIGMFFLRQRLMPGSLLYKDHYVELAEQFKIDAVIQGRVVKSGSDSRRGLEPVPFLSLHIDMYDAHTGKLLLNSAHQRWGDDYRKLMHFGLVTTSSGLMKKMAQEIINDWIAKGVVCR